MVLESICPTADRREDAEPPEVSGWMLRCAHPEPVSQAGNAWFCWPVLGHGVEPALSIIHESMRVEKVIPWCEQKVCGCVGVAQYEEVASFTPNHTMSTLSLSECILPSVQKGAMGPQAPILCSRRAAQSATLSHVSGLGLRG